MLDLGWFDRIMEKKKRWEEVVTKTDLTHNSHRAWKTIKNFSHDPTSESDAGYLFSEKEYRKEIAALENGKAAGINIFTRIAHVQHIPCSHRIGKAQTQSSHPTLHPCRPEPKTYTSPTLQQLRSSHARHSSTTRQLR